MRHTTRVGLFCACIGLLAPRVFGDAIMLEGKTFSPQAEIFLIEVEHGHGGDDGGGFTLELCKHCKVKAHGPFLFNPNLSRAAFSRDFFAPFSGVSSLSTPTVTPPTALLSGSSNSIATTTTASPGSGGFTAAGSSVTSASSGGSASIGGGSTTTGTGKATPPLVVKEVSGFATNPEPATVFLLGTGLVAGVISRRKLRKLSR